MPMVEEADQLLAAAHIVKPYLPRGTEVCTLIIHDSLDTPDTLSQTT